MKTKHELLKEERISDKKFHRLLRKFRQAVGETRAKLLNELIQLVDTSEQLSKLEKLCRSDELHRVHMDLNCAW